MGVPFIVVTLGGVGALVWFALHQTSLDARRKFADRARLTELEPQVGEMRPKDSE